jgi:O-antigen/teichoic acid export membrane protein
MIYAQVDILMVGLFLANSEAGQFFVVQKTAILLMTAVWGAVVVSMPLFSRLYHGQKEEELRRAFALFALGVGGFAFAVYCSYLVFGKFILGFFGASYSDLFLPLVILSSGYLVDAFCGPAGLFLLIAGHERAQLGILLMALLAKLAMQALIIPRFGLAGAVGIGCVSQALLPIFFCIWIRRVIGVDLSIWGAVLYFWRAASERKRSATSDAPRQELEDIRSRDRVKRLRCPATLQRDGIALLGPGTYD